MVISYRNGKSNDKFESIRSQLHMSLVKKDDDAYFDAIIKSFITSSPVSGSKEAFVTHFLTQALPKLIQLKKKGRHIIEAAQSGYDMWIMDQLTSLDEADRQTLLATVNGLKESALHTAVKGGHLPTVQLLLQQYAELSMSPSTPDVHGVTPLHLAAKSKLPGLVSCLLKAKANPRCMNNDADMPVHLAAKAGNSQAVAALLAQDSAFLAEPHQGSQSPGPRLFQYAVKSGVNETLLVLKQHHVNFNQNVELGRKALQQAACDMNAKLIETLLECGADANVGTPSPLLLVVKNACRLPVRDVKKIIDALIAHGASIEPLIQLNEQGLLSVDQRNLCGFLAETVERAIPVCG